MALVVKDRVKQTTTTTGTGSIVLNGNVDGFQTFAAALANGDTTYYGIFVPSTNAFEVGLGTWTESTATLARTTILESSNSGSAVNLTAQAEVFITQPAEKAVFQDSNGDVDLGGNKILFGNLYSTTGDLPSASTYHGMFAHVHGTGKAYYAHGGNWIELVNEDTSGNVSMGGNLTVTGDLTVNGTTTTVNTTNTVVTDSLIELANGTTGSPSNDAGIVIERGDSNNAFIGYDESADKFTVGTGTFTGASTGNLSITTGTLVANVEGNVTGDVTGNADTATTLETARTIGGVSFNGSANINLPGVNTSGNQDTSGNAATATTAGTVTTAAQPNITSVGTLTTLTVDDITINGSTISDAGDFTIDAEGSISLDANNNGYVLIKDGGTHFGTLYKSGNNFGVYSAVQDADLLLAGNDGGSVINALTLDMSAAGAATFNSSVTATALTIDDITIDGSTISDAGNLTVDVGGDIILDSATGYVKFLDTGTEYGRVYESANRLVIQSMVSDADLLFSGVDGGSGFTALTLDMSEAGAATFNAGATFSGNIDASSNTITGLIVNGNSYVYTPTIYLNDTIYHTNDTNTYINFATDEIRLAAGGSQEVTINTTGVRLGDTGNGYFQPVSGNYGSIQIDGGAHTSYEGYSIGGRAVFMHDNNVTTGLYNDVDNEWLLYCTHNGGVYLYNNGSSKLNTHSTGANIDGDLNAVDNIYVADRIYHEGDTDTNIYFTTNSIDFVAGGSTTAVNTSGIFITDGSLAEDYDALSGTTPTCNVDNGAAFSLTMSGNTTFTFSGAASGYIQGFVLQLTGNGSTVTWPSSVKWAGGTAPDAPASGETDILVFHTRDGGTNWYGVLSSDAAS